MLNAHASSPICQPSRWSLLTGRYASAGTLNRSTSVFFHQRPLAASETVAGVLARHGWRSAFFGKYHASALPEGSSYPALQALVQAAAECRAARAAAVCPAVWAAAWVGCRLVSRR